MKLDLIEIKNFRSIQYISIKPDPSCQVFVGVNESGKSNLLKAISLLDPKAKIASEDKRLDYEGEEIEDAYVKFYFTLEEGDITNVIKSVLDKIYKEEDYPTIQYDDETKSIREYLQSLDQVVYTCNVSSKSREFFLYCPEEHFKAKCSNILKPVNPAESISTMGGKPIVLSSSIFFSKDCIKEENYKLFSECKAIDIINLYENNLESYFMGNLPNVIFWEYKDELILPNSVPLESFIGNPDSCQPLKSMFQLADYNDIKEKLTEAKQSKAKMRTLLNNVAKASNKYLKKVWKSYSDVTFDLQRNGNDIDICIKDFQGFYDCAQRSDGFKRFVTFLLRLSAKVNKDEISNSIIILDEPENGIHITGQKDLVQELIEISKKNLVFFATHSIFMIDRERIDRHYVVKKEKEITRIEQAGESDNIDDEVINNALGYSVFEVLKPFNVIFEGWYDKNLFVIARKSKKFTIKDIENVGIVHCQGAREIAKISKILELANRQYIVMSDFDKSSLQAKKNYEEVHKCSGAWYTYNNCIKNTTTLEDFVSHKVIEMALKQICGAESMKGFNMIDFQAYDNNRLQFVRKWLGEKGLDIDKVLKETKAEIYSNIKPADIEDKYSAVLEKIKNEM